MSVANLRASLRNRQLTLLIRNSVQKNPQRPNILRLTTIRFAL